MNKLKIVKLIYVVFCVSILLLLCLNFKISKLEINYYVGIWSIFFLLFLFFAFYILFKKIINKKPYAFNLFNIVFFSFLFTFVISGQNNMSYKFFSLIKTCSKEELNIILTNYCITNGININYELNEYLILNSNSKSNMNSKLKILDNIKLDNITLEDYLYFYSLNTVFLFVIFILVFIYFFIFCTVYRHYKNQMNYYLCISNKFDMFFFSSDMPKKRIYVKEHYDIFISGISFFFDSILINDNIYCSNKYRFKKQYEINLPIKLELIEKLKLSEDTIDYEFINVLLSGENDDIVDINFKFNILLLDLRNKVNINCVFTYETISTCETSSNLVKSYDMLLCVSKKNVVFTLDVIKRFLYDVNLSKNIFLLKNLEDYFNRSIFYSNINILSPYTHVGCGFSFFCYKIRFYKFFLIGNYITKIIENQSLLLFNLNNLAYLDFSKFSKCVFFLKKRMTNTYKLNYDFEEQEKKFFLSKFPFFYIKILNFLNILKENNKRIYNYEIHLKISIIHLHFQKFKHLLDTVKSVDDDYLDLLCSKINLFSIEIENTKTDLIVDFSYEKNYIVSVLNYVERIINANNNSSCLNHKKINTLRNMVLNLFENINLKNNVN